MINQTILDQLLTYTSALTSICFHSVWETNLILPRIECRVQATPTQPTYRQSRKQVVNTNHSFTFNKISPKR